MDKPKAHAEYNYATGWTIKFNPKQVGSHVEWDQLTGFTDEFWVDYLVSALNNWHLNDLQMQKYGVPKL